jgi:phosphoheptose isomerase
MSTFADSLSLPPPAGSHLAGFPAAKYALAAPYLDAYFDELARAAKSIESAELDRAAEYMLQAYAGGGRVFACGNGGSAAIANHLQCDHTKGVSNATDLVPRVLSLSNNIETLTAIANDSAYENVFAHQLEWQARPGDVLIVVSSSGNSPNILKALSWARAHGLRSIALTGFEGGGARTLADVCLHVDAANYGIVEDLHQAIMHALAQYLRQSRMTPAEITVSVF